MARGDALMRARSKKPMIAPSKRGSLHRALGIPQGQKIPQSTINAKLKNASGNMQKKLLFAKNFGGK